jgi:hypothetical protein
MHQPEPERVLLPDRDLIVPPQLYVEELRQQNPIVGVWRDIYRNAQGEIIEATPWRSNLVVNIFANLAALLCAGNGAGGIGTTTAGFQYMVVGTGLSAWDTGGTPSPSATDTNLINEIARKAVTVQMVDSSGNVISSPTYSTSTNRVLVTATYNVGEANGQLREWGIVGGTATSSPTIPNNGTAQGATGPYGFMVDRVTHAVINKLSGPTNDFSLTRLVTIIF